MYSKVSEKMAYANSADPDQTEGAVWLGSAVFAIPLSVLRNNCMKENKLGLKSME